VTDFDRPTPQAVCPHRGVFPLMMDSMILARMPDVFLLLLIHPYELLIYLRAIALPCMRCWFVLGPRARVPDEFFSPQRDAPPTLQVAPALDRSNLNPNQTSRHACHARMPLFATRYSTYSYATLLRPMFSAEGVPNKSRLVGRRCRSLLGSGTSLRHCSQMQDDLNLSLERDRCLAAFLRPFACSPSGISSYCIRCRTLLPC
jgi:hypothetical protein